MKAVTRLTLATRTNFLVMSIAALSLSVLAAWAPSVSQPLTVPVHQSPQLESQTAVVADGLRQRWTPSTVEEVVEALRAKRTLPVSKLSVELIAEHFDVGRLIDWFGVEGIPSQAFYDLRGVPLSGYDLTGVDLSFADLTGANLRASTLTQVDLRGAVLREANLDSARLIDARLTLADLQRAQLQNATFTNADLRAALLFGADLTDAYLVGANLDAARLGGLSRLGGVLGVQDIAKSAMMPATLTGANLFAATLRGASFVGVGMQGVNLYDAVLCNTVLDVSELPRALNLRYARASGNACVVTAWSTMELELVENLHRQAETFFRVQQLTALADEYHFWWNEARTARSPWYQRWSRMVFLKWPYGYGSRPLWILRTAALLVASFAATFTLLTLYGSTTSGIILVAESGDEVPLRWQAGSLLGNCFYFSLLSFATFGYGAIRPRQWLEFFRLRPVEYKPVGWARVLVGIEAACGMYLFALLAVVLFGRA